MLIIDCDAYFGKHSNSAKDASAEALIEVERADGVGYAMAYSIKAKVYDAREGNDDTLQTAREHPEILPVASVDPRGFDRVEEEIERVAGLGFVAVRVFTETQGWAIDSVLFSRIVNACAEHGMPLMVLGAGKASDIVKRAKKTTSPIILLGCNYNTQAEAFSAAASRPNTFVSTQFFVTPGVVEMAVEALGADRFVLGANPLEFAVRPALNMILSSELADADKAKILGGNIARVIQPQLARLGRTLAGGDLATYRRRCIGAPIIDVHGHLGPWPFPMRGWSAADLVKLMRRRGIEKAMLSHTNAIVNDFVEGNAELARDIEPFPELLGYVTVNPNYPEKSIEEMDRYLKLPQFIGVKTHPGYSGQSIDSEGMRKLLPAVAKKKAPFLVHTWGHGEPTKIGKIAQDFPEIPFIMGHGGVTAWLEAVDTIKATSNVYTELCSSQVFRGRIRTTLDAVGPKKVMFGSDLGLFDPAYDLGIYEEADMTAEERQAVMYDNAKELFGLNSGQ